MRCRVPTLPDRFDLRHPPASRLDPVRGAVSVVRRLSGRSVRDVRRRAGGIAAAVAATLSAAAVAVTVGVGSPAQAQQITMAYVPAPPPAALRPVAIGAPEQLSKWRRLAPAVHRAVASAPVGALPDLDRIRAINARIDRVPYVEDAAQWGVRDRWTDPETFYRVGGDCEDFAIAKYVALRKAGVPAERLRIVVGYDRGLGDHHAFLTVDLAGDTYVLDIPGLPMVRAADRRGFQPIYALNEEALWRFE